MEKSKRIYYITALLIFLTVSLTLIKVRHYGYNLSSLIAIWQGFADLNPGYVEKNTVVFQDGGYDGQFFYLNARYLFSDLSVLPKVDSFYFRFHRIGLSVLAGMTSSITGFEHYALATLILLSGLVVFSGILLNKFISSNLVLAAIMLNPFVMNSTLLLVSDSLFVSLLGISLYFLHRSSVIMFSNHTGGKYNDKQYLIALLFLTFAIFTRETGVLFTGSFVLYLLLNNKHKHAILMSLPVLLFAAFWISLRYVPLDFRGTSPLGFTDMIDWPLFGFVKSLDLNLSSLKSLIVLPVFGFFLLLLLNLLNIKSLESFVLLLPLLGIVVIAAIAEEGYWRSFDNITRMFAPTVLWVGLLKNRSENYRDYGLFYYTGFFLLLLVVRILLQKPLVFQVY